RNELQALDKLLAQLEDAHKARGAPAIEVGGLVEALRDAGEVLEGIRLAEQSAELRRGLERAEKDTLSTGLNLLREIEEGDTFLHLRLDDEKVDRPVQRSDAELQADANERAKN